MLAGLQFLYENKLKLVIVAALIRAVTVGGAGLCQFAQLLVGIGGGKIVGSLSCLSDGGLGWIVPAQLALCWLRKILLRILPVMNIPRCAGLRCALELRSHPATL